MENVAAAAESTPAPVDSQEVLNNMSAEQRTEWRVTGKLPEAPKTEESATSTAPEKAEETEIALESEPSKEIKQEPAGKPQSAAEKRIKQLLGRVKELEGQVAVSPRVPVEEKKQTEKTLSNADEQAQFFKENPDKDFDDWIAEKVQRTLKTERETQEKAAKQADVEKRNKAIVDSWQKRVAESVKKHPDFAEVVTDQLNIPPGSVIDGFILDSEHGAEIVYDLAKHPEEIERLLALSPYAQARELTKLELKLSEDKAPIRQIKIVPDPTLEVGGKNAAPSDEIEAALKNGDVLAYKRLQNAKELNARKA